MSSTRVRSGMRHERGKRWAQATPRTSAGGWRFDWQARTVRPICRRGEGGTKLRLRAAAAERFILAEQSDRLGEPAEADRLRAQARALLDAAGPIAAEYRLVRDAMPAGRERTHRMEEVVDRARRLAEEQPLDAGEVVRWLREGSNEERVTALAMMQATPRLRDFDAALAVIEHPRSAFEQYHAMRLATQMLDELDQHQRQRLTGVVRAVRGPRLRRDAGRWRLSEEILERAEHP